MQVAVEAHEKVEHDVSSRGIMKNTWLVLGLMITASVIIRYILASINSSAPSIMMNEALYLSVSRSLFDSGNVLLRGNTVAYRYLLYPSLISLLHMLPSSVSIFRGIQFFNAIAISLTAIPGYLLAQKITGSSSKGLFVALLILCMPDMVMVRYIMGESIAYPLMLTLFYFFFLSIENKKKRNAIACGVLAFLLQITQSGFIAIGFTIFVMFLIFWRTERSTARLMQAICGGGIFAILFGIYMYVLHFILGVDISAPGYFANQLPSFNWDNIVIALNGALLYALFVPAAFMVLPIVIPLLTAWRYTGPKCIVLIGLLISMALHIIIIIWTIYVGETTGDPFSTRIHTRHLAMYLPIFVSFLLSEDILEMKIEPGLATACVGLAAGWLLLSARPFASGAVFSVDAHLLSAFLTQSPLNGRVWMPIIWIMVMLYFITAIAKRGLKKEDTVAFSAILLAVMLISNVSSYTFSSRNSNMDFKNDAHEAAAFTGMGTVYVTHTGQLFGEASMAIDIAYRGAIEIISFDDAMSGTLANTIVINPELLYYMVVDAWAEIRHTTNNRYSIIIPHPGRNWVHSALHNFNNRWVQEGSRFTVYDSDILSSSLVHLQLQARAGEGTADLYLTYGDQIHMITLTDTLEWIDVYFEINNHGRPMSIFFSNSRGNIFINTYLVQGIVPTTEVE